MLKYFFEKGDPIDHPCGSYFLALHKIDMFRFAIERVEEPPPDYVAHHYSSLTHPHFVAFLTSWRETEEVKIKKPIDKKPIDKKPTAQKKNLLPFQGFLSRKKIEVNENSIQKNQVGSKKELKLVGADSDEFKKVNVVYVQLEEFRKMEKGEEMNKIKNRMAMVYLLGLEVFQDLGLWPCLLAVQNLEGKIKFVKRGRSRKEEVRGLFEIMMSGIEVSRWSSEMESIFEMYEINGDSKLLVEKVIEDLRAIIFGDYQMSCRIDGQEATERVSIVEPRLLLFRQSGLEIPLEEFIITFSNVDQTTREIHLEHQIFDDITLRCGPANFIAQYLRQFRTY